MVRVSWSVGYLADMKPEPIASALKRAAGLYQWVGEEDCRRRYRAELAPDGWVRLLTPVGDVLFFLEWDRGTEPPGGATTLVAARGLGFHAIDIERDRSYLPALICRVRQPVHLQRERVA